MARLEVGDKAPRFSLRDQEGRETSLTDFQGRKLLAYFYPKADTPGCTKQACGIRDAMEELSESGITAVGISPDGPSALKRFDDKYDLGFPLLSDPDHQTARDYGAWGENSLYGRTCEGIVRSSFLINEDGVILQISYRVKPQNTVPNAQQALA